MLGRRTIFAMNTLRNHYPQSKHHRFHAPKHPPKNLAHIYTNNPIETFQMTQPTATQRLQKLGITLPQATKPLASYVPTRQTGSLIHISGQIPISEGELIAIGIVPTTVDEETAVRCARQCTLNALAALQDAIGNLDKVTKVVKVGVFVAASPDFGAQPSIANGCSDLLVEIFGQDIGQHARAAVGVASLPRNVPVEIEYIFEVS